jgi:hypothetical protein
LELQVDRRLHSQEFNTMLFTTRRHRKTLEGLLYFVIFVVVDEIWFSDESPFQSLTK